MSSVPLGHQVENMDSSDWTLNTGKGPLGIQTKPLEDLFDDVGCHKGHSRFATIRFRLAKAPAPTRRAGCFAIRSARVHPRRW